MSLPSASSNRIVLAVVASTFFVGFGGGVIFPILPNLGEVLGISAFMVGLILSANRFTRLVANAPAGVLIDRIGTRKPFIAGLAIEAVATFMYVVAIISPLPEFWFLIARILWGIGSALVFATAYTITADVSEADSRGTSMGIVRAGITFGFPAGLVLGGVVSDLWGNVEAFVLAAAFAGLASVIAYLIVPETHVEDEQESVKPWDLETSVPALTIGLVNFGLYFAYIGVLFSTLVLLLGERGITIFGLDAQGSSGMLMAITVLSGSVFTLGGGALSDSVGARVPVMLAFLVTSCVGFAVLAFGSRFEVLVLACLLIGAGQGGVGGPLTALLADLTPEERIGRAMGTNNVLGDVGGGLGPLVSLPLIDVIGFEAIYAISAIVPMLAGIVLVAGIYAHTGRLSPTISESIN
ncbi:MFS transporter [Natronorubrum bangense]|uniref:Major facilitator superfamily protein n=2 Tax=Natronorubrum bangense TaxID=61858 RepID=L9WN23_9EURY|nr:MFS transporter [Natronorubrum bangense]ELY49743.1 major facilitator superfamily protein [Natronorubrum bangense JCM 10635]QCC55372.1 MFS transporter [Natronorubrum bangense]